MVYDPVVIKSAPHPRGGEPDTLVVQIRIGTCSPPAWG